MRGIILSIVGVIILISGSAYYVTQTQPSNVPLVVDPTPAVGATRVSPTNEPTPTDVPVSVGATRVSPESLASILSNETYATLRLENFGVGDFLVAQSNGLELFYLQNDGNIYSSAGASFDILSVRGLATIFDVQVTNNATFTNGFSVTQGNISINGDFAFIGPHTISGTGALTINPTGNLNFQSSSYYINESGKLVVGELSAPKLSYVGDITIDANSSTGASTVTVTNSDPLQSANFSVEGDITVRGGKITLATGETIDAKTADTIKITSDGNVAFVLGDVSGAKKMYVYDSTGTNDVFSVDSDGNISADGNATIAGSFTAASSVFSSLLVSGNATVGGTITVGTLATGITNTVITHSNGVLQTRTIDGKVWNGALVDYLASTTGYLPMYSNSLGTLTNSSIFETGGKIGIGSSAPASMFSVGSTSQFQVNSTGNIVKLNNVTTSFPSSQGAVNSFLRNNGSGTLIWADPTSTGVAGFWQRNGTSLAPTTIGDNVGIGTTSPSAKLTINGTTEQLRLSYDASNYQTFTVLSNGNLNIARNGAAATLALTDVGVGIGTVSPGAKLDVAELASAVGFPVQIIRNTTGSYKWQFENFGATTDRVGLRGYDSAGTNTIQFDPGGSSFINSGNFGMTGNLTVSGTGNTTIAGNVGIGTTVPDSKLSVRGTATQLNLQYDGSNYQTFTVLSNGNLNIARNGAAATLALTDVGVGIGTTAPGAKLEVAGNLLFSGASRTITANGGFDLTIDPEGTLFLGGSAVGGTDAITIGRTDTNITSTHRGLWISKPVTNSTTAFQVQNAAGTTILNVDSTTGNVGIGTTAPQFPLSVYGNIGITADTAQISATRPSNSRQWYLQTLGSYGNLRLHSGVSGGGEAGQTAFQFTGDSPAAGTVLMTIDASGNTSVRGSLQAGGSGTNNGNLYAYQNSNNVSANLYLQGGTPSGGSGTALGQIIFGSVQGGPAITAVSIKAISQGTFGNFSWPSALTFFTTANGSTTAQEQLRIDSVGNVGIGTTAPGQKLEVAGNIYSNPTSGAGGLLIKRYTDTNYHSITGGESGTGLGDSLILSSSGSLSEILFRINGADKVIIDQSGNVGIGTTAPGTRLDVSGTGRFSSTLTASNGLNVTAGGETITAGNLGLGTSPLAYVGIYMTGSHLTTSGGSGYGILMNSTVTLGQAELEFATFDSIPSIATTANNYALTNFYGVRARTPSKSGAGVITSAYGGYFANPSIGGTNNYGVYVETPSGATNNYGLFVNGGTTVLNATAGNVGIGTTSPGEKFHVDSGSDGNVAIFQASGGSFAEIQLVDTDTLLTGPMRIRTDNHEFSIIDASATRLVITNTGNVGIGTTGPGAKLEIGSGQIFVPNGSASAPSYSFTNDANTGLFLQGDASVDMAINGASLFRFTNTGGATQRILSDTGAITFGTSGDVNIYRGAANQLKTDDALVVAGTGDTTIAGNVGIGTTGPASKLDVAGSINLTGNIVSAGNTTIGPGDIGAYAVTLSGYDASLIVGAGQVKARSAGTFVVEGEGGGDPHLTVQNGFNGYVKVASDARANTGSAHRIFQIIPGLDDAGSDDFTAFYMNVPTLTSWTSGIKNLVDIQYNSGTKFLIDYQGNVGIGTTGPGAKLESLTTTEQLRLSYDSSTPVKFTVDSAGSMTVDAAKVGNNFLRFKVSGAGNASAEALTVKGTGGGTGLTGINNTSPSFALDVTGQARLATGALFSGTTPSTSTRNSIYIDSTSIQAMRDNSNGNHRDLSKVETDWFVSTQGSERGLITFKVARPNTINATDLNEVMRIVGGSSSSSLGLVGIGTTSPVNKLDVFGEMAIGSYAGVNTAPSNGLIISGNVGIGTTSPGATLHVKAPSSSVVPLKVYYGDSTPNVNLAEFYSRGGGLAAYLNYDGVFYSGTLSTENIQFGAGANIFAADPNRDIYFGQAGNGGALMAYRVFKAPTTSTNTISLRAITSQTSNLLEWQDLNGMGLGAITTAGNVGIGTTGPSSKLSIYKPTATTTDKLFDVTSDVTTVGNTVFKILANGDYQYDGTGSSPAADVAEIYPTAETGIVSGEIVSLSVGDANAQTVIRSGMASDPNILGVVTTKPALLLGSNMESGVAVALIGRVPVKVNDQNGIIVKGDYITSSSTAGEGMKATVAGMVVGRALSDVVCNPVGDDRDRPDEGQSRLTPTDMCTVSIFMNVSWFDPNHTSLALSTTPIDTSNITDLTLQTLSVLSDASFVNATVTGSFNIGLLSIADSAVNVAGGVLKLQDAYGSGNIEAFGGKIVMTTEGSIQLMGDVLAHSVQTEKLTIHTADVAAASAGMVVIKAGTKEMDIETLALTSESLVFVTPQDSVVQFTYKVTGINKITIYTPVNVDVDTTVNWWIIN